MSPTMQCFCKQYKQLQPDHREDSIGGPSEQAARGHWNGNKCWDQDIENIGEEAERWGTNCDPLEIDDGWVSW